MAGLLGIRAVSLTCGSPQAAPTAYKSQQGRGDFYRLDSLVFFARNHARNLGDLVKASRAAGVQFHTQDRKVRSSRVPYRNCWMPAEPWGLRAAQLHTILVRDPVKVSHKTQVLVRRQDRKA